VFSGPVSGDSVQSVGISKRGLVRIKRVRHAAAAASGGWEKFRGRTE